MLYLQEFEVYMGESGLSLAFPFDYEGGTQGEDFKDALEMAADWLQDEIEYRLVHREPIPEVTIGNAPKKGGKVVLIGISTSLEQIAKVTASEAARELGVTSSRVSQMVAAGRLDGYKDGHKAYITRTSLDAALARERKAGRPSKEKTTA